MHLYVFLMSLIGALLTGSHLCHSQVLLLECCNCFRTDLAEWFTQRFVRVKKVLPASGTDLTSSCVAVCGHVKQLAKYAVFGEYNPTPPKVNLN